MKSFSDFGISVNAQSGEQQTTCPQCSHTRKKKNVKCLSANIDKGLWLCFHCGWSGTLKTGEENRSRPQKTIYKPPPLPVNLPVQVIEWFRKRGIPVNILTRNQITYTNVYFPQIEDYSNAIAFPYFKDGTVINHKYRDGKKNFRQEVNAEKILYGIDDIKEADTVIIVEGEIDKLSIEVAGYKNCVSVPDGAPAPATKNYESKFEYLEICKEYLDGKKIIIAVDSDPPGRKLEEELVRRLGAERCARVEWPEGCKDANEVLVNSNPETLANYIQQAKPVPVAGIVEIRDISFAIDHLYESGMEGGKFTGWRSVDEYYTVRPGEWTVVTGVPSHGKALALDTPIPTPSGWTVMGDIQIGDMVYDEKGNICVVKKATEVMFGRPCYALIFDDGTRIIADADHQWLTVSEKARRSAIVQKQKRGNREYTMPRGTDQRHKMTLPGVVTTKEILVTLKSQGKNNHQIPVCKAVDGQYVILPIPSYALGAWLGDGNSADGGVTCNDVEIINRIGIDGYKITKSQRDKFHYHIHNLIKKLRGQNLLKNKHIPSMYLRSSISQRMELLKGLMDTDGHCSKLDSRCEFTSINKRLAEDVLELVLSLGFKATMIGGKAVCNGKDCGNKYRVCFTTDIRVFSLDRKAVNQKPGRRAKKPVRTIINCIPVNSVPVRCIEVDSPSHLFLCSKSFIPTHNSEFVDNLIFNLSVAHDWRFSIFSPENQPLQRHAAKLIQKFWEKPFQRGYHERITQGELQEAKEWLQAHFSFILPPDDKLNVDSILSLAKIEVQRKGIRGLVIDPWNEIDHTRTSGLTETEHISVCLSKIRRFARQYAVHVWVVAHPTKLIKGTDGKYPVPTPYDIAGAAHWRNKADCALTVWRDEIDENKLVEIHVQKVRFREVGKVGLVKLKYNPLTGRYYEP